MYSVKHGDISSIAYIFENQGIDAGYLIAGKPKDFSKSARKGTSEIFVIEADEYDTAFFDKNILTFIFGRV